MSRAKTNKLYANFSRGLITEANPLGYPEGASADEKNCEILQDGVRSRRYGFATDDNLLSGITPGEVKGVSHVWVEPGKDIDVYFLVAQIEERLRFWKINSDGSFTTKSFSVDLTSYQLSSFSGDMDDNPCQFTSGKGTLYVAHAHMNPLSIDYDPSGDSITVTEITVKIRDFIGLDDSLAVDQEPTSLSAAHNYNLRNQGWVDPEATNSGTTITSYGLWGFGYTYNYPITTGPIAEYYAEHSRYPGNNKQWWVAKDTNGDFDPENLSKIFFGNTRAPRGHFIVDAFNKNYSAVSGVAGLTTVSETTRPATVEFSSGRLFYGHRDTVYFSPTLEDSSRAGQCFQEADPTAEDISDLIATDGGAIRIPNAENIIRLLALGSGLAVFAKNGVWFISSGAEGFTALDYSISQVSPVGTESPFAVVQADETLFWWSKIGIQAMKQSIGQFGPISGSFDTSNLTEATIKRFYNNIGTEARKNAYGIFDPATNKVMWLYKNASDDNFVYKNILTFDSASGAFVPWSMKAEGDNYFLTGGFASPYFTYTTETIEPTFIKFIAYYDNYTSTSTSTAYLSTGNFTSKEYVDFYSQYTNNSQYDSGSLDDAVLMTYDSYIMTGYEVLEDGLRRKQAPVVGVFFLRGEESIELDNGNYVLTNPQSCFFQSRWDWSTDDASGKWSTQVQAYRPKMTMFVDTAELEPNTTDYEVFYTRLKVRGSGRAAQYRFSESRQGYGFTLIGWHVFYEGKTDP